MSWKNKSKQSEHAAVSDSGKPQNKDSAELATFRLDISDARTSFVDLQSLKEKVDTLKDNAGELAGDLSEVIRKLDEGLDRMENALQFTRKEQKEARQQKCDAERMERQAKTREKNASDRELRNTERKEKLDSTNKRLNDKIKEFKDWKKKFEESRQEQESREQNIREYFEKMTNRPRSKMSKKLVGDMLAGYPRALQLFSEVVTMLNGIAGMQHGELVERVQRLTEPALAYLTAVAVRSDCSDEVKNTASNSNVSDLWASDMDREHKAVQGKDGGASVTLRDMAEWLNAALKANDQIDESMIVIVEPGQTPSEQFTWKDGVSGKASQVSRMEKWYVSIEMGGNTKRLGGIAT